MEEMEAKLKEMIISKYGSVSKFCDIINMPWTTLDSILKRGIANSNITNVMKITRELNIDTEMLASGKIVPAIKNNKLHTIAAHFDGDDYTEEELEDIRAYAEFVKNRRNRS